MIWQQLIRIAFLGTDRSAIGNDIYQAMKAHHLATDQQAEEALLESLAYFGQRQKLGRLIQPFEGELHTAPTEQLPTASSASAKHLHFILNGDYQAALEEFLHYLAKAKKELPPEALPPLLAKAQKNKRLWQQLKPILGARAKWLIHQHPEWCTLMPEPTVATWEEGDRASRSAVMSAWLQDQPEQALQQLQESWPTETAADKKVFLELMGQHLHPAFQAFLEKTKRDKHKDARKLALELLAQLPNGLFQSEVQQLGKKLFRLDRRKLTLVLTAADLDALEEIRLEKPRKASAYQQELGLAEQLLSIIEPTFWEQEWKVSATAILELFAEASAGNRWLEALTKASLLHQNKPWAEAIVQYWLQKGLDTHWRTPNGKKLLQLLSNASFNTITIRFLKNHFYALEEEHMVTHLLCMGAHRWDDKLTVLIVRNMQNRLSGSNAFFVDAAIHFFKILKVAAYHCNPNLLDTLKAGWYFKSHRWSRWEKEVENFLRILMFRKEMLKALKS
ncbi:MAG: DUF5691 domain-containing protein [Bacteroidota bacterium]